MALSKYAGLNNHSEKCSDWQMAEVTVTNKQDMQNTKQKGILTLLPNWTESHE
jgi:hypothetical protein